MTAPRHQHVCLSCTLEIRTAHQDAILWLRDSPSYVCFEPDLSKLPAFAIYGSITTVNPLLQLKSGDRENIDVFMTWKIDWEKKLNLGLNPRHPNRVEPLI